MVKDELEPMYTEEHAASLLGIRPRSLRTERENGRIGYKPVCGRIMYRLSDLVRWQKRGVPWRADGRRKGQNSSSSQDGKSQPTRSVGRRKGRLASLRQVRAISDMLKKSSGSGSSLKDETPKNRTLPADVIPLKRR